MANETPKLRPRQIVIELVDDYKFLMSVSDSIPLEKAIDVLHRALDMADAERRRKGAFSISVPRNYVVAGSQKGGI